MHQARVQLRAQAEEKEIEMITSSSVDHPSEKHCWIHLLYEGYLFNPDSNPNSLSNGRSSTLLRVSSLSRNFYVRMLSWFSSPSPVTYCHILNHSFTTKCNNDINDMPLCTCSLSAVPFAKVEGQTRNKYQYVACLEGGNWCAAAVLHANG
ncbi:hypothetical protein BDR04DRAFT_580259 [Suillus decipiens]|nr:hypothetical protein BDR04DRAFT_580259 [Suillus decipiens]